MTLLAYLLVLLARLVQDGANREVDMAQGNSAETAPRRLVTTHPHDPVRSASGYRARGGRSSERSTGPHATGGGAAAERRTAAG
jgi:hypothetical protein